MVQSKTQKVKDLEENLELNNLIEFRFNFFESRLYINTY